MNAMYKLKEVEIENDFRQIIKDVLESKGVDVDYLRNSFKADFQYYNFRDFMKGKKNVCSINFFKEIMRLLKEDVEVTIDIKPRGNGVCK